MLDSDLEQAILALPKAELHLHLEGTFTWESVRRLLPESTGRPVGRPWSGESSFGFERFLDIFHSYIRPATGTVEAVQELTAAAVGELGRRGVRYAELIISQSFHRLRGLSQAEVLAAVARGRSQATHGHNVDIRLVYGINRHAPIAETLADLARALEWQATLPSPVFEAVDLQGDETVGETRDFKPLFDLARGAGLRLRAHAGELCGPASVRDAIDVLGAEQLSHGVRAVEDPGLVRELAAREIWLHVCPSSNVQLGVFPSYAAHPLRALLDAGCRVTVSTDDPLIFGVGIVDELRNLVRRFGLSRGELAALVKAGFEASQLDPAHRRAWQNEVDVALESTRTQDV